MNVGTEDIRRIILRSLKRSNAVLRGMKYGSFATDVAEEIYELFEGSEPEMSKRDWNLIHNFPPELEPIVKQFEKGFSFLMKRDEQAQDVYRWISEQDRKQVKMFIAWALDVERVKFVGKYRNEPGHIKNDWKLAMQGQSSTITKNEDGSINV